MEEDIRQAKAALILDDLEDDTRWTNGNRMWRRKMVKAIRILIEDIYAILDGGMMPPGELQPSGYEVIVVTDETVILGIDHGQNWLQVANGSTVGQLLSAFLPAEGIVYSDDPVVATEVALNMNEQPLEPVQADWMLIINYDNNTKQKVYTIQIITQ